MDIPSTCGSVHEPFSFGKIVVLAYRTRGDLYFDTMQAGDRLDFIQPFDVFTPVTDQTDTDRQIQIAAFATIMGRLAFDRPDLIEAVQVLEESGFVTIFESSHRLDMADGSYLHILAYGHQDDEGLIDAGVSVIEHLPDGTQSGGYIYTYDEKGVRRSTVPPYEPEEPDQYDTTSHFSVIQMYAPRDELDELAQSDDEETVLDAMRVRAEHEEDVQVSKMMAEAGFDDRYPHDGELEQLADLVQGAYHFPLSQRAA